jgi:hypothetical protein
MNMMNRFLPISICLFVLSCGQPENKPETSAPTAVTDAKTDTSTVETVAPKNEAPMPYAASRTSDWVIGDKEKIRTILNMYKHYDENMNYEDEVSVFADSIEFISFDARRVKYKREDFIAHVKKMRDQYNDVDLQFKTYVCLHSDSLKVDMVTLWINERVNWKNGTKESSDYIETWLFNEEGKIFRAGDYSRFKR